MNMRVDIVSKKTGRVLLSSLFDSPPEGLTRRDCQKVIGVLGGLKTKLESITGRNTVRITLDDYPSSVFWYLVLFRPVVFDSADPWFGGRPWSIFEMLEKPKYALKLKEMNLGVIFDPDRNWLTLFWDEARKGILDGIEKTPTWRNILRKQEKRLGHPPTDAWWKLCARNHSFTVPNWRIAKQGYLRGVLWHRPGASYDDIIVFNLAGIDIPRLDDRGKISLPVAKRANFTHFYTKDKREFVGVRKQLNPRRRTQEEKSESAKRLRARREKRKEELAAWTKASRAIADIQKIMGMGVTGRPALFTRNDQVIRQYEQLVNAFIKDELRVKPLMNAFTKDEPHVKPEDKKYWEKIENKLDIVERCLQDPRVPREFSMWLNWRERGAHVISEDS